MEQGWMNRMHCNGLKDKGQANLEGADNPPAPFFMTVGNSTEFF